MTLLAYADRRVCRPGDTVTVMAASGAQTVTAELVRILDGTPDPGGAPASVVTLDPPVVASGPGVIQRSVVGSRADLPLPRGWDSEGGILIRCWVFPTTAGLPPDGAGASLADNSRMAGQATAVESRRQVIWAFCGGTGGARMCLVLLPDGRFAVEVDGDVAAVTERPARTRTWYGALVALNDGVLTLDVSSAIGSWYVTDHVERVASPVKGRLLEGTDLLRLASSRDDGPRDTLNGKVASPSISVGTRGGELPRLLGNASPLPGRIVGAWDPSIASASEKIVDTGPNGLDGRIINLPGRGMTGPFWNAGEHGTACLTPQHDAIHFHTDDVGDLGWEPTLRLKVPDGIGSGLYMIRVSADDGFMHVPLFIRPLVPQARVAFLASTNTYLAYANHRMFLGNDELHHIIATHPVKPNDRDVLVLDRPFLGRSLYDTHDDGSGVHIVSWHRPLVSFEPAAKDFLAAGPRNFQADLYIVGWLERSGLGYDVITDEDVHAEGIDALRPYDVVITGSHPEYWSRRMMDGLRAYLMARGKLMYLGGNGFYWLTGFTEDRSAIEIRRGPGGTRAWDAGQGELVLSTTGELAGTWRTLGLPPQSVVGVGFTSQGWGGGRGYKRMPQSFDPRVAAFFDGIGPEETIGDFGIVMDGAAGDELDRMDYALGTPPNALRLATSLPFPDQYQLAVEEVKNMTPTFGGSQSELVRSDIVWFELPGGGEVFSVGSVSWAAAMGWNHGGDNVARLTTNVLTAFLDRASGARHAG